MDLRSKLGLGTVQFGTSYGISNKEGKTSIEEVHKIVDFARINSIRYIDTAYAYGDAEKVLGSINIDSFNIISKYKSEREGDLVSQFKKSLNRLNISCIYGYLAHRPLSLIENNNLNWNRLVELKKKGRIKNIGASFNEVEEVEKLLNAGVDLDIIQIPYNYLDRRFEDIIKELKGNGCEIHARSAFLQGLFFCEPNALGEFFDEVKPILKTIQKEKDMAVKLLKFVLEKEFIDVVNIGVNNVAQLRSNIRKLNEIKGPLPELDKPVSESILLPSGWPK
jgi:aryl-alcohol dehydrogenase-like predicted oxidoreductase